MQKILLGVSGSIAAYKSLLLVRLLVKQGKEVKVVMTPAATEFVSQLTFSTLSKNEVYTEIIDDDSWSNHVELGLWADVMIIAPATANTLGKMANGLADNMLLASYLSAKCPVFFAPAMDLDMWHHPSTKNNVEKLISYGNHFIPVGHGELASGLVGEGRMAEPEEIVDFLDRFSKKKADLKGKKVFITAGPTKEAIDPVRFISNHSTGKMGIAIAEECVQRGASVTLILGPTDERPFFDDIQLIHVESAQEMLEAAQSVWDETDIAIFSAAVADYTPVEKSETKVKKKEGPLAIELKRTGDIAGSFGTRKTSNQFSVGFALETNNEEVNAVGKLNKKNFDIVVLNSLREKGAGFKHNTNKVTIFTKDGGHEKYEVKSKRAVAVDIIDTLVFYMSKTISND